MAKTPHKANKHRNRTPDIPKRSGKDRHRQRRLEPESGGSVETPRSHIPVLGPAPNIDLTARVLYRDAMILVIDKPAGIASHGGPSGHANIEAGLEQLRFGAKDRPTLAHRLDHDTSGCLAIARGVKGAKRLGRLFREGLVEKTYWAIVEGEPAEDAGRIEAPLAKVSTREDGWRIVVDPAGKAASTDWRVLKRRDGRAFIEFKPQTGRTHQIRVHAAHLGCPIVGDTRYGAKTELDGFWLQARSLLLPLYQDREAVMVEAPAAEWARDWIK